MSEQITNMKKRLFLLPVGILITLFSIAGMARVNASNEYTSAYYADFSEKILSAEQPFTQQQAETGTTAAVNGTDDTSDENPQTADTGTGNPQTAGAGYVSIPAGDYIYIEGTGICYPLVQGEDNSFYLNHLPDGTQSPSGSIFMDYQNVSMDDFNVIIYGHNMKNGTMFGQLSNYGSSGLYAEEHDLLTLSFGGVRYLYELFCFMRVDWDSPVYQIDPNDKEAWIDDLEPYALNVFEPELSAADHFVTLSTCGKSNTEKVITIWKRVSEE